MRWMLAMLVFVPVSIVLHFMNAPAGWVFLTSALAIVPLAGFIGKATEELAKCLGPAIGGLLTATFGNATELIIAIVAVRSGQIEVVKASLIGSVIGNVLLVLGASVLVGGLKHKIQVFNKDVAQSHATMLALAVIALIVPALFVRERGISETAADPHIAGLSMGVAGVLVVLYLGSLVFSFRMQERLFADGETESEGPPEWPRAKAMVVLVASTVMVAVASEFLVGSIEPVIARWHVGKLFLGVILLPIIGNAAEHSTAVMMAAKNKMDVALNIAISSSTQIAMFVAPLIIFISPFLGHPVTILFSNYELIAFSSAAAIAVLISMDGKSHWLEGAQLLAVYVIVGLAFFYIAR